MTKMNVFLFQKLFLFFVYFFKPISQSDSFRGDHPRPCLRGSQHSQNTPVANAKNRFVQFPLPKLSFCYGPCILYTRNDSLRKYLNHGLLEHFHEIKTLSVVVVVTYYLVVYGDKHYSVAIVSSNHSDEKYNLLQYFNVWRKAYV